MEHITDVTGMALQGSGIELLSARIHENQAATRRGFENAVPMSVAGLAAFASTDERADELLGTLRRGSYPHLSPGEVVEPEAVVTAQSTRGFLARIFGGRLDDIVDRLAVQSSVSRSSASMLLGLAAPLVLDAIGKEVKARNLDARGLSRFLADEGRQASASLPDSLSGMVSGAAIGDVPSMAPAYGVRGGVIERVDEEAAARDRARRAELEARAGARERAPSGWWIPALWVIGALALVGLIVYLVSRAGAPERRSVEEITPEGAAPSGQITPSEPPAAPAAEPPGRLAAPPVTPPAAEPAPEAPSTAQPAEKMMPASPEGAAGELSDFLQGNEATPHRIALTGMEFAVGSAAVSDTAMLDEVAEVLAQNPDAVIRVEGHTDATGGQKRNQALSRERAEAVKDHLVAEGVAAGQIKTSGKASNAPMESNDSEMGRAQNRRVDLVVIER